MQIYDIVSHYNCEPSPNLFFYIPATRNLHFPFTIHIYKLLYRGMRFVFIILSNNSHQLFMKNLRLPFIALTVISLLCACNPYTLVNSETYSGDDLAGYSTFRIVNPESDGATLPPSMSREVYYNIAADIRQQMETRGFREDPSSDLLINIALTEHKAVATEPVYAANFYPYPGPPPPPAFAPYFMYPRQYYWPAYSYTGKQVVVGIYKAGVLTMDMFDIKTKKPLYTASVAAVVRQGTFTDSKGIAKAVRTLFSQFPLLPKR